MKIAIFGASGEIGIYLVRYFLKKGHHVIPIVRSSLGPHLSRFPLLPVVSDYQNEKALLPAVKNCHLAVNCVIEKSNRDKLYSPLEINLRISRNLIRVCQEGNVKYLVHLSSLAVLPSRLTDKSLQTPFSYSIEQDPYVRSKIETEKLFLKAVSQFPVTVLRPGIVYGANMSWSKSAFSKAGKQKIVLPEKVGRCYAVHPIDIARLIDTLTHHQSRPVLVYAINPEPLTWRDFFTQHGAKNICVPVSTIRLEHFKNQLKKQTIRAMSRLFQHSLLGAPLRIQFSHQLGKKIVSEYLISTETASTHQGPLYPTRQDLEIFQSNADPNLIDYGQSVDFKYAINFKKGCQNARNWHKYHYGH